MQPRLVTTQTKSLSNPLRTQLFSLCLSLQLPGKIMTQKIRVTTKADQFEKRKQEHLQVGYQIQDEQPVAINGLCSFTAVRIVPDDEACG
jgi:hypothetical protein